MLDKQTQIQWERLSKRDQNIYHDSEQIPVADWNLKKCKREWIHGELQERRIKRPRDIRSMYKALHAAKREKEYRNFLSERGLNHESHRSPR